MTGDCASLTPNSETTPSMGVWTALNHHTNPLEQTPRPNTHVIVRELTDRHGPYFVMKNTEAKTYLRLSPTEHRLWSQLDGQTTVQALIVNMFMETGEFAHARVTHLIHQLHAHHMLAEKPLAVWRVVA